MVGLQLASDHGWYSQRIRKENEYYNTLGELREAVASAFEEEAEGTTPPQRVLGVLTRYLKAMKQQDEDLRKLAPVAAA